MTLFYDTVGPAASGVAVARAAINAAYRVPSKARELVGVRPFMTGEALAAADAILAVWDILGNDFRFQPCEGFMPVGAGQAGDISHMATTPMETWFIHAPLNGNETLNLGVEPLSAFAGNGEAGFTMIYSTVRTGRPTIYGLCTREIALAVAAATITDVGDLRVDNGLRMHEICGIASAGQEAIAVDEELAGYFTLRCSSWDGPQENRFFHSPLHALEGASGNKAPMCIMRLPLDTPFKGARPGAGVQATISADHYNYDVSDVLSEVCYGVRWIGAG